MPQRLELRGESGYALSTIAVADAIPGSIASLLLDAAIHAHGGAVKGAACFRDGQEEPEVVFHVDGRIEP